MAIAHASGGFDPEAKCVVDAVRAWKPPFNPSGATEEAAAFLKAYGVCQVTGDRYAGQINA